MRKIEKQMIAAIKSETDWKCGNTKVVNFFNDGDKCVVTSVFLHDNLIAEITDTDMMIFDGGYQSVTTKSRLNALCSEFCITGEGVFQKDFAWYVRKFVGAINGQSKFVTETFNNGYIFAWSLTNISFMKTILIVIIGVLLWQSTDAREFTSNALQSASDIIEPDTTKNQSIGERIDSFLDWIYQS